MTAREVLTAAEKRRSDLLLADNFTVELLGGANEKVQQAAGILDGLKKLDVDLAAAIAAAQQHIAAEKDKVARTAEADVMDSVIAALEGAVGDFASAAELLIEFLSGKAAPRSTHASREYSGMLRSTVGGVLAHVATVTQDLKFAREAVLAGRSAGLKPPGSVAPTTLVPKAPVMVGIFAVRTLRYTRGRESVVIERYQQGELPPELARFAIEHGYAVEPQRGRGFRDLAANAVAARAP